MFITVEGGEGSGKTSAVKALSLKLNYLKIEHIITREPGGTAQAEKIRSLFVEDNNFCAESEALLVFAARIEHFDKVIKPALDDGKVVICDRFIDSTYAYQHYAREIDPASLELLDYLSSLRDWLPFKTYFFDCPPEIGVKRSIKRALNLDQKDNRFESFDLSFHERVYNGFLTIVNNNKERFNIINAINFIAEVQNDFVNSVLDTITLFNKNR